MSLLTDIMLQGVKHGKDTAIIDDQRSCTYAQLAGGAFYLADWLDNTCPPGPVGIMLPSSSGFVISLLGSWLAGRTVVPLNFLLGTEALTHVVRDSGIGAVLTADPIVDLLEDSKTPFEKVKWLKLTDLPRPEVVPLRVPPVCDPDDVAVLMYTSGTSGKPKGVMLTHDNLAQDVKAAIQHVGLTQADTFLGVLPQFHSFGLTALTLIPLTLGSKIVYSARFIPRKIVGLMRQHRPDVFMAVPSMYSALLGVKKATAEDFASIRLAVSGAEPLPQTVFDQMRQRFGIHLLEGYGLTETSPATHWAIPQKNRRHSVGTALPCVQQLIVDEQDQPLPAGKDGELLLAGPMLMKGYHRRPDLNEQVFVTLPDPVHQIPTRFFRTGDIAHVDEDGFLFITGRKKEMLIVGGENVFPREIEEVLDRHESVAFSAVIGMADPMRGEVPIAFVQLHEPGTLDQTALRSFCRQSLPGYKVPRQILEIEQMPLSPTGKILRRALSERLTQVPRPQEAGVHPRASMSPAGSSTAPAPTSAPDYADADQDAADAEADLVLRLKAKDPHAYQQVIDQYLGRLLAVARRMVLQDADAQDVVGDAMLQAFRKIDQFDGRSRFYTWLHRIVINAALMQLRKKNRHRVHALEDMDTSGKSDAASGGMKMTTSVWQKTPVVEAQREELRQFVREKIQELPDHYRDVLLLRDIEELDTRQTAAILEIAEGAVKTRLHRARQALRQLLDPRMREERQP